MFINSAILGITVAPHWIVVGAFRSKQKIGQTNPINLTLGDDSSFPKNGDTRNGLLAFVKTTVYPYLNTNHQALESIRCNIDVNHYLP